MITSSQNPKLKLVRSLLGRSKERREAGAFVVEGVRLVEEALTAGWPFRFMIHADGVSQRGERLIGRCRSAGIEVEEVSADLLQSISETGTSQGILAVLQEHQLPIPGDLDFILIADQIHDPGNLGTLLRSAAAAGAQALLLSPDTVDPFAPKVLRSGMGGHFRLPIQSMDWEAIAGLCRDASLEVFLAEMQGDSCWSTDLLGPLALIVGSEAEGASEKARQLSSRSLSIPMQGAVESLNAGVAGSILMFEVARQRQPQKP